MNTTVGIIDMGDVSLEIAFNAEHLNASTKGAIQNESAHSVDLFGQTYDIYSKSYLCYGLKEALRQWFATLAKVFKNLLEFV